MASSPPGADPTDGLDPPGGGSAVAQVTSGLRRAGTQVKRIGRKILGTAGQALPLPLGNRSGAPLFPDDGPLSPPRVSSAHMDDDGVPTPGGKSRYGRLDPRRLRPTPYADHPTPPEGYVNVWVDNFRRWQKRWLVATTPGVLIFHRRSTKIGPSTSVDLTVANVVVSDAPARTLDSSSSSPATPSIASARSSTSPRDNRGSTALKTPRSNSNTRDSSCAAEVSRARCHRDLPRGRRTVRRRFRDRLRIGRGARAGRRQARVSLRCVALAPDARPRTSTFQTARGVFSTARARASIGGASRGGSARGREGMGGEDWTRRTGRPGGGGRIRDERVGVREQRDGAPFRDGARGGDREVRVGRGGVRSSPRAQVARLSAALAEFTGLGGGGEYAPSRSPATTPPAVAPPSIFHEDTSGQGHARAQGQNAPGKTSVSPVVVTPGESSAFTRALLEKEEDASSSSSEDDSDEYGSVASFVTTGSSFRAAGSAHGGDDADEYIAAMEVINKHDYFTSAHAAATGATPRASEDGDRDRGAVGDDDGSDSDEEAVSEASADDWADDDAAFVPRARLPAPQPVNQSFSLWDILKQSMGKDLSRISMPANINQPLSTLQRMTEDFEYLHLLYDAVDGGSGINRMTALVGFVASSYASWYGRQQKPFAPTLGETYDWTSPDGRVRVVCEQVIYADPPACAFRATGTTPGGRRFVVDGEGAGDFEILGQVRADCGAGRVAHGTSGHGRDLLVVQSLHARAQRHQRTHLDRHGGRGDGARAQDGRVGEVSTAQGETTGTGQARRPAERSTERCATPREIASRTSRETSSAKCGHDRIRRTSRRRAARRSTSDFASARETTRRRRRRRRVASRRPSSSSEGWRRTPRGSTASRVSPSRSTSSRQRCFETSRRRTVDSDRTCARWRMATRRRRRRKRFASRIVTERWRRRGNARGATPARVVRETRAHAGGQTWGKHVNFLEHQCALWVYKGGYWEQRASGGGPRRR